MDVDVSQILELASDFKRASSRVGKEAADNVRKTTTAVERSAKRNAPVGKTGDLKAGIHQTITGSGRGAGITGTVSTDVDYIPFVEEGTATQAPQPVFGPAAAEHKPAFDRRMDDIVNGVLR